jgi:hypothetical protein
MFVELCLGRAEMNRLLLGNCVRFNQKQNASRNPFRTILATAGLPSWFGLLWGLRLSSCSAIAVKQDAVRAQIADQRVQIVGQLLIV